MVLLTAAHVQIMRCGINEMVKILEEEYVSARDIYLWVIEVLQDARVSRSDLVPEISSRVPPAPGPV